MEKESINKDEKKECKKPMARHTTDSALYFFGFIGAAIYYISTASTFWIGVIGFLKAMVWPAFLVFEALKYLGA